MEQNHILTIRQTCRNSQKNCFPKKKRHTLKKLKKYLSRKIQVKVPSLQVHQEASDFSPKEAELLSLDTTLVKHTLGVSCKWNLVQTINHTTDWYMNYLNGSGAYELCLDDLDRFEAV